ncbi:hypothetical protein KM043_003427 [Ampulex compressa]|nr:hypothetical protein KM043_003427 [Ampulex compressa]
MTSSSQNPTFHQNPEITAPPAITSSGQSPSFYHSGANKGERRRGAWSIERRRTGSQNPSVRGKREERKEGRVIERGLYDWTFRAFLRKGRAGTRVLLAKTKERRLDGPRNCPTAFIYAPNRGKRCKSPGPTAFLRSVRHARQGYYLPGI